MDLCRVICFKSVGAKTVVDCIEIGFVCRMGIIVPRFWSCFCSRMYSSCCLLIMLDFSVTRIATPLASCKWRYELVTLSGFKLRHNSCSVYEQVPVESFALEAYPSFYVQNKKMQRFRDMIGPLIKEKGKTCTFGARWENLFSASGQFLFQRLRNFQRFSATYTEMKCGKWATNSSG